MKKEQRAKLFSEIVNAVFDDGENNIEHVDLTYSQFITKLRKLADL